jgi:iron complex outermembrane receptor protein
MPEPRRWSVGQSIKNNGGAKTASGRNIMVNPRRYLSVFALALVSAVANSAFAQQAADDGAERIDEITVTAQRRAANIQDVPISISAFSAEFIEKSGVETLQDIALYSPNFTISTSSSKTNQRLTIRGVGSVANNALEPSVGVFIDGIYYPRTGAVLGSLIDLEVIEVLRGPQGTLFGRNTAVGALNIRTQAASRDKFESTLELGAGSHNSYHVGGSISGPFSDAVAFRLSGVYNERDGFGDNAYTGRNYGEQDDFNIRGKLEFDLSSQFNLVLSADYGEINGGGQTVELMNSTVPATFLPRISAIFGPAAANVLTSNPTDHDIFQDHQDLLKDEQWGLSATAEYRFGSGHVIKSITGYREWEAANVESTLRLPTDVLPRVSNFSTETFSQELQLLSPEGQKFEYIAGLYYYDETYLIDQDFDAGANFCTPLVRAFAGAAAATACAALPQKAASDGKFDQKTKSTAVYGQGTWNANDQLSFTLGGRYTNDDKTGNFVNTVNNRFVTTLGLRSNDTQLNLDAAAYGDTEAFTYFLNASYFATDDVMLFATTSTGYKAGGFNSEGAAAPLSRAQRGFAPEEIKNYEIGVKSQIFGKTLQFNATAFRMDIENYQDRSFDGVSLIVRNAGELRAQGVETDFIWAPLNQLTFTGGLAYLDTEFLDYRGASPLPGGQPQDLTGASAHFAPEWQGSLVADWTDSFTPISGADYFLRGETQFVDDVNVGSSTNQDPQTIQKAYSLLNARLGLRANNDRWEASLFGRNLADEGYCVNFFEQPFGAAIGAVDAVARSSAQRCVVGEPRTWGVQLKFKR